MPSSHDKAKEVFQRVDDTLKTAQHGFEDLIGSDLNRRMSGLRNLIVFGRSTTFVIQNLRSIFPDDFDQWYAPEKDKLKINPLARYFVDARNELEKQGKLSVGTSTFINAFSGQDIRKFGRPPVGAKAFFIGDNLGGSGWEVELANGTIEKYYVSLPTSVGSVTQHFTNLPTAAAPELSRIPIEELCRRYLALLSELVARARTRFLDSSQLPESDKLTTPYLRRVK